jgi:Protein of unknwon function (DUF3310)
MNDTVNHPPHYTAGKIECIDALEAAAAGHSNPFFAHLTLTAIKYLWRWPSKGGVESLEKAKWYIDRAIIAARQAEGSAASQAGDRVPDAVSAPSAPPRAAKRAYKRRK